MPVARQEPQKGLQTWEPLAANLAFGQAQLAAPVGALQDLPNSTDESPRNRLANTGMGTSRIDQQPPGSSPTRPAPRPQDQAHLLQRGRAELDGDVVELLVLLRAEVADDVGVLVRLPEQLDLAVHEMETLGQETLHSHVPAVKLSPARRVDGGVRARPSPARAEPSAADAQPGQALADAGNLPLRVLNMGHLGVTSKDLSQPWTGRNLCSELETGGSGSPFCRKTASLALCCV